MTKRAEFGFCGRDSGCVFDFELDAHLGRRVLFWPSALSEARFGGLGQRPDAEVFAAFDALAKHIISIGFMGFEWQAAGLDQELFGLRACVGDQRDASDEEDFHASRLVQFVG